MTDPFRTVGPIGTYREFDGQTFLGRRPWAHPNPRQRGGAWQAEGGLTGSCYGVSMLYALCGCEFDRFMSLIETPKGLAFVRGTQNLERLTQRENLSGRRTMDQVVLRLNGLTYRDSVAGQAPGYGRGETSEPQPNYLPNAVSDLGRAIRTGDGTFTLNVAAGSRAHMAVACRAGDEVKLFDINFGERSAPLTLLTTLLIEWLTISGFERPAYWTALRYVSDGTTRDFLDI